MCNYSNMFMNMIGSSLMGGSWMNSCNSWSCGSTIPMLFDGVSNNIVNYDCNCGCGSSSNMSAGWGHYIGMAATGILGNIACGLINRPQQKKSDNQQGEQQFKDALKSLGISENTKPENLTDNQINSKELDPKYETAITRADSDLRVAKAGVARLENELTGLSSEIIGKQNDLTRLLNQRNTLEDGANTTGLDEQIASLKGEIEGLKSQERTKKTELSTAKSAENTAGGNLEKAKQEKADAQNVLDDAKDIATKYIQTYKETKAKQDAKQLDKDIDNFDGTKASRARYKNYKVTIDDSGNINGSVSDFAKEDWQKLLCAYRKGNDNERTNIKNFLTNNKNKINISSIDSTAKTLIESILGETLS